MARVKSLISIVVMISLVIIVGATGALLSACSSHKEVSDISTVSFERHKVFGENMQEQNYVHGTIDVKAKTIKYGNSFDGENLIEKQLTDEQFNNVTTAVMSEDFTKLPETIECEQKDVIGPYTKIVITYTDGKTFTTGGIIPDNDAYNKAYKAITHCVDMNSVAM